MVLGRAPGFCSQDKQRQMTYGSRRDKVSLHKDSVRIQNSHVLLPATTQAWCFHKLKQQQQTKRSRNGNQTNCGVACVREGGRTPAAEASEPTGHGCAHLWAQRIANSRSVSYRVKPCFEKMWKLKRDCRLGSLGIWRRQKDQVSCLVSSWKFGMVDWLRGPKGQVNEHKSEELEVSSEFFKGFIHDCSWASLETNKQSHNLSPSCLTHVFRIQSADNERRQSVWKQEEQTVWIRNPESTIRRETPQ